MITSIKINRHKQKHKKHIGFSTFSAADEFAPMDDKANIFDSHLAADNASNDEFAQKLAAIEAVAVKDGDTVKGQVVEVTSDVVVVDVGLKSEGRIAASEFRSDIPRVGDIVEIYVERVDGRRGTVLSREKALRQESWDKLAALFEANESVTGVILNDIKKGGFIVDLDGVHAFLPGSLVDVRAIKDPSILKGTVQQFKILSMDKRQMNIVVSRKAIIEESRSEERLAMLEEIQEGSRLKGFVKSIKPYGAFIDLGCVDGLLHITDMSWSRVNNPYEILKEGQEIEVIVTKFDADKKHISLGLKQLEENPWPKIAEEFPVGKIMTRNIKFVADYGAFVELKEGVEGLVHISEVRWGKVPQDLHNILSANQEVQFVVLGIDTDKNRISLSMKRCNENPLVKFSQEHPVGSVITAPVRNITDFAMFVALAESMDGMIHESDISWEGNGAELLKSYSKGDQVECKVLNIDLEKDRVALGIKQLTNDPYEGLANSYSKNAIVTGSVTATNNDGVEVSVDDNFIGFIKKADLSSSKAEQRPDRFMIGDKLEAKIIAIDKAKRKLILSVKEMEYDALERVKREYGSSDSGAILGDILGAALEESRSKS